MPRSHHASLTSCLAHNRRSSTTIIQHTSSFSRHVVNLLIILIAAVSLFAGNLASTAYAASAQPLANCSIVGDYCYGYANWPGGITGTSTEIEVTFITCGTCTGHVSNETWITDSNCGCDIEAGYSTHGPDSSDNKYNTCDPNQAANCYFWADLRPNGGSYHEHTVGNIPKGDYGGYATYEIYLNSGTNDDCGGVITSHADWTVYIAGPSNDHWDQRSTCNQMYPNSIQTGEELENSGAASPATLWIDNQWQNLPRDNWTYQGNNGSGNISNDPPKGYWYIYPTHSSTGGEWEACTSGC
jgi:hypothetical protein